MQLRIFHSHRPPPPCSRPSRAPRVTTAHPLTTHSTPMDPALLQELLLRSGADISQPMSTQAPFFMPQVRARPSRRRPSLRTVRDVVHDAAAAGAAVPDARHGGADEPRLARCVQATTAHATPQPCRSRPRACSLLTCPPRRRTCRHPRPLQPRFRNDPHVVRLTGMQRKTTVATSDTASVDLNFLTDIAMLQEVHRARSRHTAHTCRRCSRTLT